jgi:ABC-type Fe3+-hydroxamate transport system substrate-binding protein
MKDQLGYEVYLPQTPRRIVSLVPSQTELLFDLGLDAEIVGITKFCIYPAEKTKHKTKIGGTKNFNVEAIAALKPDLIIGNKEENYQTGIEQLREICPIWLSDIVTFDDALAMIQQVGTLVGKPEAAESLVQAIKASFQKLPPVANPAPSVAYFIWRKPYMVAASGTFIHEILQIAGFRNVFGDLNRYPEVSAAQLQTANPDCIFLSSEPYPFKEKHLAELRTFCPNSRIQLVDGEIFSWYGSRLRHSAAYFESLCAI